MTAVQLKDSTYAALVQALDGGAPGLTVDAALAAYRKAATDLDTLRKAAGN